MAARNRKLRNTHKKAADKAKKPALNLETLRQDFTNPVKLQHSMDFLSESIRHDPDLAALRFPYEKLLNLLDDLAETSADELDAMPDMLDRRIAIVSHAVQPFLTRTFINTIESALMKRLETVKTSPKDFRAAGAGLYFLEIHKRQGGSPGSNPLWNIVFDISYDEAMASAGGAVKTSSTSAYGNTGSSPPTGWNANTMVFPGEELSRDNRAILKNALQLIESNTVDIALSIDTVVLGLRELAFHVADTPEKRVAAIQQAFLREIGVRQCGTLALSLEHAIDTFSGRKKRNFQTVFKALKLLPPVENPVVFAIYYKSVTECIRFLGTDEGEFLDGIMSDPYSVEPILVLGRYLLTRDSPNRALNAFMAAIHAEPAGELARLGAGIACKLTGSFREARLHWDRAARLWSGYLPVHHPVLDMIHELIELDDDAELPVHAYNYLFFDELAERNSDHGETDSDSNTL